MPSYSVVWWLPDDRKWYSHITRKAANVEEFLLIPAVRGSCKSSEERGSIWGIKEEPLNLKLPSFFVYPESYRGKSALNFDPTTVKRNPIKKKYPELLFYREDGSPFTLLRTPKQTNEEAISTEGNYRYKRIQHRSPGKGVIGGIIRVPPIEWNSHAWFIVVTPERAIQLPRKIEKELEALHAEVGVYLTSKGKTAKTAPSAFEDRKAEISWEFLRGKSNPKKRLDPSEEEWILTSPTTGRRISVTVERLGDGSYAIQARGDIFSKNGLRTWRSPWISLSGNYSPRELRERVAEESIWSEKDALRLEAYEERERSRFRR